MNDAPTYIARWYVNGKADIALVAETDRTLAEEVVRVRLENMGIKPDRGKVRMVRWEAAPMSFRLLTFGGHA